MLPGISVNSVKWGSMLALGEYFKRSWFPITKTQRCCFHLLRNQPVLFGPGGTTTFPSILIVQLFQGGEQPDIIELCVESPSWRFMLHLLVSLWSISLIISLITRAIVFSSHFISFCFPWKLQWIFAFSSPSTFKSAAPLPGSHRHGEHLAGAVVLKALECEAK